MTFCDFVSLAAVEAVEAAVECQLDCVQNDAVATNSKVIDAPNVVNIETIETATNLFL